MASTLVLGGCQYKVEAKDTKSKVWEASASAIVSENYKAGLHNNVIYVGSEQAVKDAGLGSI